MSSLIIIAGLFLISSLWIILYFFETINQKILHLLIALGAGTMFSVSLVHILPETLEESNYAIYAFILGFLFIYLLEEILTPHSHDHHHHDHSHEDPHEHYNHVVTVAWIAIFIHTLFDGLSIRAWFAMDNTLGLSILSWVAIHQIPVSLSVASMLRESLFSRKTQIVLVITFGLAASLGFIISAPIISHLSPTLIAFSSALAGGSLLYVSNVELLPMIHAQSTKKMKYITVSLFVLGVIGMSLVAFFE
jgi:zinc transporter ZupT